MSQYKAYPKYKDSSIEWIGLVPEHWKSHRLDSAVEIVRGNSSFTKSDLLDAGEYVALQYGRTYKVDEIGCSFNSYVNREFFKDTQIAEFGDTVLISTSETLEDLGHSCFYARHDVGLIGGEQFLLKPRRQTLGKYLYYMTKAFSFHLHRYATGLKVFRFGLDDLKTIYIPNIPLAEQTAIAATLDRETARIDALIEKKTRFIELLKEKRQALITHAVTKGLDPNVPMKDSGIEWIGQVPGHWEVKRLRHVAIFNNSSVDKKSYEDQEAVRLCNYTDVYYNEFITSKPDFMVATASNTEIEKFSLKQGDVIITKDSEDPKDIGIPAFVLEDMADVICGYHLTVIKANNNSLSGFIHRSIMAHPTKAHFFVESPGITRFGLNQDAIGNIPVCMPPKDECIEITENINAEIVRIDTLVEKTKQSITLLKERRAAFITAAVTGQIDLRGEH